MPQTSTPLTRPAVDAATARKAVLGGAIGNVIEQYDNVIYGYSAAVISKVFFPASSPTAGLLLTFAVFAVGFGVRPLGAMFFGYLGDRVGRRSALVWSVIAMAVGMTAIMVLPGYSSIGIAAPLLLLLARLIQGFSVGGEWAGSTSFLVEYGPNGRRGLYGSWNQVSTAAGFLLGAAVSTIVTVSVSTQAMQAWAWRLPFLGGVVTAIVALWIRRRLDDTPEFRKLENQDDVARNPLLESVRTAWRGMIKAFGFTILWTASYFLFLTYLPTYLIKEVGVSPAEARISNTVALIVFMVSIPFFGALSDRWGRKPLLLGATVGFVALTYPIMLLIDSGSLAGVYLGQLIVAMLLAAFSGPGPAALAEMFHTKVRYSALSVGYNFSEAAFGGTAPLFATALIALTGSSSSVAIVPIVAGLLTLLVVVSMRETARLPLR